MIARYQAKYTEVLINLLENERVKPLIDNALSTYPIYEKTSNNEYIPNFIPTREELNKAILDYYKYREIGFETVGRFLDELQIAMNEIMPYYNQLMFSLDQDYDIKFNVDYTRNIERNTTGNDESTTSSSLTSNSQNSTQATDSTTDSGTTANSTKHIRSNTPQDSLSITAQNIDNVTYADEVNWNKDNGSTSGTHSGTSTASGTGTNTSTGSGSEAKEREENEEVLERTKGNYGQVSVQSLIEQYRNLILNIKQDIINDRRIAELFMTVY